MFFKSSLLSIVSSALLVRTAYAFNGTANLGFFETTVCDCPPWNGVYAVAVSSDVAGDAVCCDTTVTLTFPDNTVQAVFSGFYDGAAATEDVALSPMAFGALAGHPWDTSLYPVAWSFN